MKYIVFDTETTGLPKRKSYDVYYPYTQLEKYEFSRLVSIAWAVYDGSEKITTRYFVIKPVGFTISNSSKATEIHGITSEIAEEQGVDINTVFLTLLGDIDVENMVTLVAHNLEFDWHILLSEISRISATKNSPEKVRVADNLLERIHSLKKCCTMKMGTNIVKIPHRYSRTGWKYPSMQELHKHLFGVGFTNAHNAEIDMLACNACYQRLVGILPTDEK
jgi:DNA polymerase III epsilon subunit-like protein